MINFDEYTNENKINHNPNWPYIASKITNSPWTSKVVIIQKIYQMKSDILSILCISRNK